MKKFTLFLLLFTLGLASCKNDEVENPSIIASLSKAEADKYLAEKMAEIQTLSTSVTCTNPAQWSITPIGAKACGGPTGYVAYSITLDKETFLKKVAFYTALQQEYNKKFGIFSDCSVALSPSKVECVDGKAVLVK